MTPDSFTCPRCGAVSHHPEDVQEGYCGRCHDSTGGSTSRLAFEEYLVTGQIPPWRARWLEDAAVTLAVSDNVRALRHE